jgi:hypothetical protein
MAKILELKLKWIACDRQNSRTLSIAKTYIHSMTTNATNKGVAAVICRVLQKNVLYQCDLKWELPFSLLYTKDFLGSNFLFL